MSESKAVYDRVLEALIGAKLHLEAMPHARVQGQHDPEAEAVTRPAVIQHLATAAELFHGWWMAQQAPLEGQEEEEWTVRT